MGFLDDVRAKRKKLADVLFDEDYSGIREIVEELYPDRAHFIYELLQNAEDTGATEASFTLTDASLVFEHNGAPFSEEDVLAITNIGKGSKRDLEDKIGRFGVGFKAVFAYCETPHIWSPTFSFSISKLVMPTEIANRPDLGRKTRFEFPFNNPKKAAKDAYNEILDGLNELAETTLLFLTNLQSIRWQSDKQSLTSVLRVEHSEQHVEVTKRTGSTVTSRAHFLRFCEPVRTLEKQRIAVAFALDYLPNVSEFVTGKPLAKQLKIVPANAGRVAVFFPAEKEASGLRFHLHAPFVPELSRASIKETPVNQPLFEQLAALAASSLHIIRDQGLLTNEFLGVLPNAQDPVPDRYEPIRKTIVEEMDRAALTPTYLKGYAAARHLLQARTALKELLSPADLEFLIEYEDEPPQWAISAAQRNSNADRFLSALAIKEWDVDDFVRALQQKARVAIWHKPAPDFEKWLANKPLDWHQRMYALLRDNFPTTPEYRRKQAADALRHLQIVRRHDGTYGVGPECYFPSDDVTHDEIHPRIEKGVYTAGKNKKQQEDARAFLEEIGVREVGKAEEIEALLKRRYTVQQFKPNVKDIERFVSLVEKDRQHAKMFADYYIFEREDGKWGKPGQLYLDAPYKDTSLAAYFRALGDGADRSALSQSYLKCPVSIERLSKFAEEVGVQFRLEFTRASCRGNLAVRELVWCAGGGWSQQYGIDRDYTLEHIAELVTANDEALSRLIWRTACELKDNAWLRARYRNNSFYQTNEAPSQLVCILRDASWVPQTNGQFVCPAKASRELLPKGFVFDEGYEWLKAVRFGEEERLRSEEHCNKLATAKSLGFVDQESLERARQFVSLPPAEQQRLLEEYQHGQIIELPENAPRNPAFRAARVSEQAAEAREKSTEMRMRAVPIGLHDVKERAEEYLRQQYTNADGEMICQICKVPLPFKLDDGRYYVEKVELLDGFDLRHYQNYLALCPNHSAMFQYANASREALEEPLLELRGSELEIILAGYEHSIYFTATHIADLMAVIEAEHKVNIAAAGG